MIGVDYELFWTLNPKSLSPFIRAFELKRKYESALAWEYGVYVKKAITSSFSKEDKYPTSPIGSEPKKVTPDEKMNQIKNKFLAQMVNINGRLNK